MSNRRSAYLYRVALTTGLKIVEREKKQAMVSRSMLEPSVAPEDERRELLARAELLEELLAQLKPDESRALKAYLAGYNHVEIARLFGWTQSVARHNVYRSIDRLRRRARNQGRTDWMVAHG